MRLRPFKTTDADIICTWLHDAVSIAKWSATHYTYPLTAEQIMGYYHKTEADDKQWMMTATDDNGNVVGSLFLRRANYEESTIHFAFVVVSDKHRGEGLGTQMISLAVKYCTEILGIKKITLSVFENNPQAQRCYEAVGFVKTEFLENTFTFEGKGWNLYNMTYTK